MGSRRSGREACLQCLYLIDVCNVSERESLHIIASADTQQEGGSKAATGETYEFAKTLLTGIVVNLPKLDEAIERYCHNWKLKRMAAIDRNILRMAAYEILHCLGTPEKVIINEAVEIAKKYSTDDSGKFVNGILDRIKNERTGVPGKD
ncbi:MAG: transcription antitermination factor NusB [Elusimicrobiota bacterium]